MGVHSGKHGVIHLANPAGGVLGAETFVRNWTMVDTSAPETYVASNTRGGQFVNKGVTDWNGTFDGFGKHPSVLPGDIFDISGYTAPDTDVYGEDGKIYSGKAICDSVTITWNWLPSQSLEWSATFSAAEAGITISDGFLDDVNNALPERMCALKIDTGAALSEVDWPNVTTATLTLNAENQSFVNSTTACFTHRKPGNFSWTLAVTDQETDQVVAKADDHRIRIWTDASNYWLLEWGHLTEYTGLTVSRESGAIIEKTANFIMQGSDGTNLGQVAAPGGSPIWWPIPVATP